VTAATMAMVSSLSRIQAGHSVVGMHVVRTATPQEVERKSRGGDERDDKSHGSPIDEPLAILPFIPRPVNINATPRGQ
jgi:hypothetical protein